MGVLEDPFQDDSLNGFDSSWQELSWGRRPGTLIPFHGGLSVGHLNFLTEWWLGSKRVCPKSQEMEAANFLEPWCGHWHNDSSGVFYRSVSHRVRIGGEGTCTPPVNGRLSKQFVGIFSSRHGFPH